MDQTYLEQLTTLMDDMRADRAKLGYVELGYLSVLEDLTMLVEKQPIVPTVFDLTVQQIHRMVTIIAEGN